jgi:hypothetical protein
MIPSSNALAAAHEGLRRGDIPAALSAAEAATQANPRSAEAWWVLGT